MFPTTNAVPSLYEIDHNVLYQQWLFMLSADPITILLVSVT